MIFITGSTGFIGKEVVKNLLKNGYENEDIKIFTRDVEKARKFFPDIEAIKGNFENKNEIKKSLKNVDIVIHLAGIVAYKPLEKVFRINYEYTKNLLGACTNVEKVIFSSTVDVMGEIRGKADENYVCKPTNFYGMSKYQAEKLFDYLNIPYNILRIAPVYGIGAEELYKILNILKLFPIVPKTGNLTQIVHVSDAAQAIKLSLKHGNGIYIIANENPIKIQEFCKILVRLLDKNPIEMPMQLAKFFSIVSGMKTYFNILSTNRNYNIGKAKKELKFKPKANFNKEIKNMIIDYKR
jgi:nucleoside-diphosphate-sugar epimerase